MADLVNIESREGIVAAALAEETGDEQTRSAPGGRRVESNRRVSHDLPVCPGSPRVLDRLPWPCYKIASATP